MHGIMCSVVSETEQGVVECLVQQCPPSLHSGFMDLFPGVAVNKGKNHSMHLTNVCLQSMHNHT